MNNELSPQLFCELLCPSSALRHSSQKVKSWLAVSDALGGLSNKNAQSEIIPRSFQAAWAQALLPAENEPQHRPMTKHTLTLPKRPAQGKSGTAACCSLGGLAAKANIQTRREGTYRTGLQWATRAWPGYPPACLLLPVTSGRSLWHSATSSPRTQP